LPWNPARVQAPGRAKREAEEANDVSIPFSGRLYDAGGGRPGVGNGDGEKKFSKYALRNIKKRPSQGDMGLRRRRARGEGEKGSEWEEQ